MGNFYVNITLKGPGRDQIVAGLTEACCDAYLSPTVDGVTMVCEAVCDSQDDDHIRAFAAKLSERLGCPALAVLNHDDDVLWYGLYAAGVLDHEYNSAPDFFEAEFLDPDDELELDDDGVSIPEGGDAQALCAAFGPAADPAAVETILRALDDDGVSIPEGGDAQALCAAFGPAANPAGVETILRALDDESGYVFAFERHDALAKALGLPAFTVCCGYRDLERGDFPDGYGEADFVRCAAG